MTPSPKTQTQAPLVVRTSQGRVKSYTPPIVPGHHHFQQQHHHHHHHNHHHQQHYHSNGQQRNASNFSSSSGPNNFQRRSAAAAAVVNSATKAEKSMVKEIDYFAGAKFDCLPSVSSLPTPPAEWTIPVLRSQSQPSSPVTAGVKIDVSSLFLTPQGVKSQNLGAARADSHGGNGGKMKNVQIDTQKTANKGTTAAAPFKAAVKTTPIVRKNEHLSGQDRKNHPRDFSNPAAKTPPQSTTVTKVESSKPIDITPRRSCGAAAAVAVAYQPKQLYPHLTEHLKCLLKVQG